MTPMDALKREVEIELEALIRRLGTERPDALTVRIEFDRETGMPRTVECQEERKRRILGPQSSPPLRAVIR